jgi:hypothetical protein
MNRAVVNGDERRAQMNVNTFLPDVMHQTIPNDDVICGFYEYSLVIICDFESIECDVAAVGDLYSAAVYPGTHQDNALAVISLNGSGLCGRATRAVNVESFVVRTGPDVQSASCL